MRWFMMILISFLATNAPVLGQGVPVQLSNLNPSKSTISQFAFNDLGASVEYSMNRCSMGYGSVTPPATITIDLENTDAFFDSITENLVTCQVNRSQGRCSTSEPVPVLPFGATAKMVAVIQQNGPPNCRQRDELSVNLTVEEAPLDQAVIGDIDSLFLSQQIYAICELFLCLFDPEDEDCEDFVEDGISFASMFRTSGQNANATTQAGEANRVAELYWKRDTKDPNDPNDDVISVRSGKIGSMLDFTTDIEIPATLSLGSQEKMVTFNGSVDYLGVTMSLSGQYPILQLVTYQDFKMTSGETVPSIRLDLLPQLQPNSPTNPEIAGTLWFNEDGAMVGMRFFSRGMEPFYLDAGDGFLGSAKLSINTETIKAGDPFIMTIDETAGSGINQTQKLDFYVGVVLPDGTFYTFLPGGALSNPNQLLPLIDGRSMNDQTYTLVNVPWPQGLPAGAYKFRGGLVRDGANVLDANEWLKVYVGSVKAQ